MLYSLYRTVFHTILNTSLVGCFFREQDAKIAFDKLEKGENRKLKGKTRIRRAIRAISPVISVLLMIAIAVAASLIAYAWIMGYIGGTTTKVGRAIQIQSMGKDPDNQNYLLVYVQNVGQGAVEFDPRNCAYIDDMLGTIGAVSPNPLAEGKTATIRVDLSGISIDADELIKVKVVTKDGTFSESKSNVPFSDMSSTYVLALNVNPSDGGTVTPNLPPPYAPGTSVQLTANPNAGWIFAGWSGDLTGSTNPETIVMNGHKTVTATFTQTQIQYDVTFALGSGGASMSPTPGVHTYDAGASVAISAIADGTHTFSQWTADTASITFDDPNAASTNAHISDAGTITANFAAVTQQVTFISAGTGSGTTNGNPTPGYPTGLQANDLILLQVTVRGDSTPTITPPAGFALLYGPDATGGSGYSGDERVTQWIYYKFSTGSESGTDTVTITGTNYDRAARMYAFRNVALTSFTEGASFGIGNDDVILAQSLTTSGDKRLAVSFVSVNNDISVGSFTGESGGDWTEAVGEFTFNGDDDLCMQLQTATMASAGTIQNGSYDTGFTNYRWVVRAFALVPA
jgi:uncharacterized repeat protein (TIGR02543 family)